MVKINSLHTLHYYFPKYTYFLILDIFQAIYTLAHGLHLMQVKQKWSSFKVVSIFSLFEKKTLNWDHLFHILKRTLLGNRKKCTLSKNLNYLSCFLICHKSSKNRKLGLFLLWKSWFDQNINEEQYLISRKRLLCHVIFLNLVVRSWCLS